MPGNRYMPPVINSSHFADEMCNSMLKKLEIVSPIELNVFVSGRRNVQVTDKLVHASTDLTKIKDENVTNLLYNEHYNVHLDVHWQCTL